MADEKRDANRRRRTIVEKIGQGWCTLSFIYLEELLCVINW